MNTLRLKWLIGFWVMVLSMLGIPGLAQAGWIPIGTQWDLSSTIGINKSGQVICIAYQTSGGINYGHSFLYSSGQMTDLGNLGGSPDITHAYGINNSAQIVGESNAAYWTGAFWAYQYHAFLYSGGTMTDLGNLSGNFFDRSCATAINDKGQVTGYSWGYEGGAFDGVHAFLYTDGKMTDLGSMEKEAAYAQGINNSGQVVGYLEWTQGYDSIHHAFFYSGSQMIDIHPQLPNNEANESYAYGINDSGQVAGYYYANDGYSHPFLYANGVWKDLGTLDGRDTMAYAINDHGQIVGQGYSAKGRIYYDWQACLYSGGQWVELPPFDVPSKAYAINDPGQIAGMIGSSAGIYFPPRLPDIFNLLLD